MEKSTEFVEKSRLLGLERELAEYKHSLKMHELEFERESQCILHDRILERGRIARAEERRMLEYKQKLEAKQ